MVAAVGPEQQRVLADLRERGGRDAGGPGHDLFEQPLLAQTERRQLIVDDRIDRDRRLRQPVGERLLTIVELTEAVGLQLDESGVATRSTSGLGGGDCRAAGHNKCERRERHATREDFMIDRSSLF